MDMSIVNFPDYNELFAVPEINSHDFKRGKFYSLTYIWLKYNINNNIFLFTYLIGIMLYKLNNNLVMINNDKHNLSV